MTAGKPKIFSLDYQESYPSTVLFKNCHGIALFMDELFGFIESSRNEIYTKIGGGFTDIICEQYNLSEMHTNVYNQVMEKEKKSESHQIIEHRPLKFKIKFLPIWFYIINSSVYITSFLNKCWERERRFMKLLKNMTSDLVAFWDVPLSDGLHRIEFEHGTTTGKRLIRVDGEVILKRDWMFKLVGSEFFNVGKAKCVIRVDPVGGFSYSYSLTVNGKNFNTFAEIQSKALKTWIVHFDADTYRVVLEKETLDIWANGEKLDVAGEFVENGTETHFTLGEWPACIKAVTSGHRREGIIHHLIVNDKIVPERIE